ncbi:unnamed protein product [Bursaphelenchus okinawaensis]|uniref:C2 domain-containing protein n=1 Tax=Bursaphelenchus okinawaensis TaxID=465554 RepID=A0A811JTS4_9BILA|nr:unnamed protein product [Bursaphelenchus okinawaensis]CAG9082654.1 unnamed protein product [Bursaphelenchus okinawaensis]
MRTRKASSVRGRKEGENEGTRVEGFVDADGPDRRRSTLLTSVHMVCAPTMHSKIPQTLHQFDASTASPGIVTATRRRLPPTPHKDPPDPGLGSTMTTSTRSPVTGLLGPVMRRSSSPRMLPTPPLPPASCSVQATTLMNNSFHSTTSSSPPITHQLQVMNRRPSTGRRLPDAPAPSSSSSSSPFPSSLTPSTSMYSESHLPPSTADSYLYRSASARNATSQLKAAQLPPAAPRSSIASSDPRPEMSTVNRLVPEPLTMPKPMNTVSSAPQTPRESNSDIPAGYKKVRKCSFNADVGRDSLSRNGSMAHLLEQQHLLRREFNATPDSVQYSTNSSLSPSIEQLNIEGSQKDSSDGEDPSHHGLNPSLYLGRRTPSSSISSVNDIQPVQNTPTAAPATEPEPRPKGLGLVHCSLQHFPVRKRLRVSILKIEGLAGELRPDLEIQAFCKVNILPGKANKQQVSVVKRGRDIVYNAEFFFDNISVEDIDGKSLALEVYHQGTTKIQKDLEIGQIMVPLKELTQLYSKKEVRIVEELKFKPSSKKLGKIFITTCLEKEARRLTINVIKVEDLPKWGIIGSPDVCVRITLSQNNGNPQTKSTRVLKSTCTAVYKEAVMFLISTSKTDLSKTKITISVHDVLRSVTGDDVIGSAYLGELAVDKSEQEQWKNTSEKLNKEFKGSHQLKPPNQAPDVHVSEMPSDDQLDEEDED